MEWRTRHAGVMLISFGRSIGYQRADRAFGLAFLGGPIQTILLTWRAEDRLRVLRYPRGIALSISVLQLGVGELFKNINREQFVLAHALIEHLLFARGRVKGPPVTALHDRNRQRPVLGADVQYHPPLVVVREPMHLIVAPREFLARVVVGDRISTGDYFLGVGAENRRHLLQIIRPGSFDQ